jgi:hypothetical protein
LEHQEIRAHTRRYRTVTIQGGRQTLTAAEPVPDDLAEALAKINSPSVRTSLIKVGVIIASAKS